MKTDGRCAPNWDQVVIQILVVRLRPAHLHLTLVDSLYRRKDWNE
jgi:hypothetical protein